MEVPGEFSTLNVWTVIVLICGIENIQINL